MSIQARESTYLQYSCSPMALHLSELESVVIKLFLSSFTTYNQEFLKLNSKKKQHFFFESVKSWKYSL